MAIKKSEVEQAVLKARRKGKLSCKSALNLAQKLGTTPGAVGRAANATRTKIVSCQLGLFK